MRNKRLIRQLTLLVAVALCAGAGMAEAVNIRLNWNPSSDPTVSGYKIYYSATSPEGPYDAADAAEGSSPLQVNTDSSSTLTGLADTKAYYFTVTAFNAEGAESAFSNVVSNYWMPRLEYPANAAAQIPTSVTLRWSAPDNPERYDFTLYLGTNPNEIQAAPLHLLPLKPGGWRGGPAAGAPPHLLLVLVLGSGLLLQLLSSRRRWLPAAALTAVLLASCGGGGSGTLVATPDGGNAFSQELTLEANTTYYWRVEADDGQVAVLSELHSFTTGS